MRSIAPVRLFAIAVACIFSVAPAASGVPVQLVDQPPVSVKEVDGVLLVDFGKVAFGNVRLVPPAGAAGDITFHFGEMLADGRVNRKPPGSVRYAAVRLSLAGSAPLVGAPPADKRNTAPGSSAGGQPPAVRTPPEWGVVMPFRWVEIEGWTSGPSHLKIVRQAAFATSWDDDAAAFKSSDETLNRIWELCRYSVKATTFAGIYVDGDRERIPYEADAYLNQLSHYATDHDVQMARETYDRLMKYPTWPTEWAFHMIFMAHADWMRTGDSAWLAPRYEALKGKLLLDRARGDGLLLSNPAQMKRDDLVDWPAKERDGYVFKPVNTVVNAFHLRSLTLMANLANALGKTAEAADYKARQDKAQRAFQEICFDASRGIYRDGDGTTHASQHANLFPLAFGLVPAGNRASVIDFIASRGMACSVYAAQYLMEGLFSNEAGDQALALITGANDRSWKHMLDSGTTITWEAWDQKYKPNQDWNHVWGAAPANLFPRFILGVQERVPGWTSVIVRPHPGGLKSAAGKIPTPRGPVMIAWENGGKFNLTMTLPVGVSGSVELPAPLKSTGVFSGGKALAAQRVGARWKLDDPVTGTVTLEVR